MLPDCRERRAAEAYREAGRIAEEDVDRNRRIGEAGVKLIRDAAARKPGEPVNVLTHCNAGALATVDYGTALGVIRAAHEQGKNVSKGPRLGEEDFLRKLPLEMADYPKPILAAINGHAVGVGMTMAMPCDIRIVAEDAKIVIEELAR